MSGSLEDRAAAAHRAAYGPGGTVTTGAAPGRVTLVGEHVDYADGLVVCAAVDEEVAVAVRPSRDRRWRVVSGRRHAERDGTNPAGDVGDRPLATAEALRRRGVAVPPVEMAIVATLPEAAGLSSSAALCCAVVVALLRLSGARLRPVQIAATALTAEREIVGVPCGPLDQRAVVETPAGGALLLDCRDGTATALPGLPPGHVLVACQTGASHDVGGAGYRSRRLEAEAALAGSMAPGWRDLDAAQIEELGLPAPLDRRARHIVTETARAAAAADALRRGDAVGLGRLMSASHASLRDDYEVSTPALDAIVAAATAVPGCCGARMVGAGFGGTAIALVSVAATPACMAAMRQAAVAVAGRGGGGAWQLRLAPGVAAAASDVVG